MNKLEPGEVAYGGRDATGESVVAKIEQLEATQPADLAWDCAGEAGVGEVEHGEEREVTEVRAELSLERDVGQLDGSHTLPPPATTTAGDAHPLAERRAGRPVAAEDAGGVGELRLES